ncbi:hypothetical protein fugu_005952 [Takifugu bimaculatus]|uniref:LSM domain-containing protein n=1 Tax=Takifugu bimaculatus TaxID=433685 RepID=A0A4Z2B5S3_9TELE|nr:hypothetical protein fugu_005952 [Takifugu bimaculatus]
MRQRCRTVIKRELSHRCVERAFGSSVWTRAVTAPSPVAGILRSIIRHQRLTLKHKRSGNNAFLLVFQVIGRERCSGGAQKRPEYLNIKLTDISVTDPEKYPHMLSVKNCFIRGSVVRYVQLPADEVDTQLLQDAARKEAMQQKQ